MMKALARGLSKRCPHCGRGAMFSGWSHQLDRCDVCGLVYERNAGDTWFFTVIGDRIPMAIGIVLVYFGVANATRGMDIAVFGALIGLLIWTTPNRWGIGIALHYLSRLYWPDPGDPIPGQSV